MPHSYPIFIIILVTFSGSPPLHAICSLKKIIKHYFHKVWMENQTNYCRFPKSLHLKISMVQVYVQWYTRVTRPVSKAATYLAVVSPSLFAIFFSLVHDIGVCKCITNPNNSSYRNVTFLELKPILRLLFLLESEQFLLYLCYNQAVCYNKRNRMQKPKPSVMFRSCPLKYDPPERRYSSFNLSGP